MEQENRKEIRRAANGHGIMIILFYGIVLGCSVLAEQLLPAGFTENQTGKDIVLLCTYLFQYLVAVPVTILVFCKMQGKAYRLNLRVCIRKPSVDRRTMIKWWFIGLGIIYTAAYVSNFASKLFEWLTDITLVQPDFTASHTVLGWVTNLLAMIVLAPIFEEAMFRGTIYRSLWKYGSFPVLACGILFGLWHINYGQLLYAAVMGIVACMMLKKTGSLLSTIAMHMIMNTLGAIQSLFIGDLDMEKLTAGDISQLTEHLFSFAMVMGVSMLIMLLTGTGIILLIVEWCSNRESLLFPKPELPVKTGEVAKVYLTAPCMLLCLISVAVMTVLRAVGKM